MDLVEASARAFASGPRHPWERARLTFVSRLISSHGGIAAGDVIIDVGCGDTFVVESLARRFPTATFYAVDRAFTPELIRVFDQRLTVPNVTLRTTPAMAAKVWRSLKTSGVCHANNPHEEPMETAEGHGSRRITMRARLILPS